MNDRDDRSGGHRDRGHETPEATDESPADDATRADREREDPPSVKEQLTGTYMYLPETQVRHLRRQYNLIKAEYEFEYGEKFEKNRHFYPLVITHGLKDLNDMDVSQIRSRVQGLYE